jgi:hypothetical protein
MQVISESSGRIHINFRVSSWYLKAELTGAGGEVRALYLAAPLFAVSAVLAPAVAHATPIDDYVSRNGKAVCAALDKVDDGGDIFRLSLHIAKDGGFSVRDAANIIAQSAGTDCPWNSPKLKQSSG